MDEAAKKQPNYGTIGLIIGLVLALAFIIIGSTFFGLKPGPSSSTQQTDTIDPSLYAPSN